MADKQLVLTVYLTDPVGRVEAVFGPGDDVPGWAALRITNPLAWGETAGESPAASPVPQVPQSGATDAVSRDVDDLDVAGGGPPPRSGPGASRRLWADYAESNGVAVEADWRRDDIIAACERAGIAV